MDSKLQNLKDNLTWQKPQIINVDKESDIESILTNEINYFFDSTKYATEELYDIDYPHEKDIPKEQKSNYSEFIKKYDWPKGAFIYFPWDKTLVRFPNKQQLRQLRTSRNRNLVTADEQNKLYNSTIFIAGLSVGSNIVEALVSMGIGNKFILADMDVIEPSNLNRIRAPYKHVGIHKADSIAMRMSEIDPYLDFQLYKEGINKENLLEILDVHKPDIIIDEMDQIQLKIIMRKEAQKRRIPVLSAADDGDSCLLDIERYDQNKDYPIYHGMIPDHILNQLETKKDIPRQQMGALIGKYFIGADHIPLRMFQSLSEVGKSLPSWPQLGNAAAQAGLSVAFAAKHIILDLPLRSGRFVIGPDQVLEPEPSQESKQELDKFKSHLNNFEV